MGRLLAWRYAWLAAAALCACAPVAPTVPADPLARVLPHYRCDDGTQFTVNFAEDMAIVDAGKRGSELLLRDAGGITPQQVVYSNVRLRAEFGLGADGREAVLHYLSPSLEMHCRLAAGG
jgi:hypothetical protein